MNNIKYGTPVNRHSAPGQEPNNTIELNIEVAQSVEANTTSIDLKKQTDIECSENLKTVLASQDKLKKLKSSNITFSEPVLSQNGNPVIFPHTINVIQGQSGAHKSRLAETMCSAFLKSEGCTNDLLGFSRTIDKTNTVVYVDTERNLSEQLPSSLQSIQIKAGYQQNDHPENFEYISLLEISRRDRFNTLAEYIKYIADNHRGSENTLFVVLDVSTDCIEDFNRVDKSMELIDLMNMAINNYKVIFLCIIHENPNSNKGRGHFGTELMNKASTVIQVGFEKDANQNETDIIRVKYLKCRSTSKHIPFYVKYNEGAKGLVLADDKDVKGVINNRKLKATNEDVIEIIEMLLGDGTELARVDLIKRLCAEFQAKERTIEARLKDIMESDNEIVNKAGISCKLVKEQKDKTIVYKLAAVEIE